MKLALFFSSLVFASAAFAETKTIAVTVTAQVAVQNVKAACVQYVNGEGEGDGYRLFYAAESVPQVTALKKTGLSATYVVGNEFCAQTNKGTLTFIDVPEFSKNIQIDAQILAAGGYKDLKVVFYDYDQFGKDLNAAKANAFNAL